MKVMFLGHSSSVSSSWLITIDVDVCTGASEVRIDEDVVVIIDCESGLR